MVSLIEENDNQIYKAGTKEKLIIDIIFLFFELRPYIRSRLRLYQGKGYRGTEKAKCRRAIVTGSILLKKYPILVGRVESNRPINRIGASLKPPVDRHVLKGHISK